MEHREPPRIGRSEGPTRDATEPAGAPRFARLVPPPHARRLVLSRLGLALLVGALALFAGSRLVEFLRSWVDRQPTYRLDFDQVVLDPPPPNWLRGGKDAFLRRIPIDPSKNHQTSVLDIELDGLLKRVTLNCWVKNVVSIRRSYPNRLEIRLEYRIPVMRVSPAGGPDVAVDAEGNVLPMEDLDPRALGPLPRLLGIEKPPPEGNLGKVWKARDEKSGLEIDENRVVKAAKLAQFLKSVRAGKDLPSPLPLNNEISVNPDEHVPRENLWLGVGGLKNETSFWVHWSYIPESEIDLKVSAEEKWRRLVDWVKQGELAEMKGRYLIFTESGIVKRQQKPPRS